MNSNNIFINNIELLQAISNWQIGSSKTKGKKLEKLCSKLPQKYRTLDTQSSICYRRIDLTNLSSCELIGKNKLEERVSSWTIDCAFAKDFKNGVPRKKTKLQGTIFKIVPKDTEIIVNLHALYICSDFLEAMEYHKSKIKDYHKGAGKYKGSQSEIVLKINHINQDNIYSFGGFSSLINFDVDEFLNKNNLDPCIFSQEIQSVVSSSINNGWWLSETGTQNALGRILSKVK